MEIEQPTRIEDIESSRPLQDLALITAAEDRGIVVVPVAGRTVQFGRGRFGLRVHGSWTSAEDSVAIALASNKSRTKKLLREFGLPVGEFFSARSAEQAIEFAERIDGPVVVKPISSNMGRGISTNLQTPSEIKHAYGIAVQYDRKVVVEAHATGRDYRLLVIDGKLAAASERDPAHVIGDGKNSIAGLVDIANTDPRREDKQRGSWTKLDIDGAVERHLANHGHSPTSVPADGERVDLRAVANTSSGGTAIDVTANVHPENREIAERAARVVGLAVAGVDIITPDIAKPISSEGGFILEVNAKPGLRKHIWPASGESRNVLDPIVDMLFPEGDGDDFVVLRVDAEASRATEIATALRAALSVAGGIVSRPAIGRELDERLAYLDPDADCAVFQDGAVSRCVSIEIGDREHAVPFYEAESPEEIATRVAKHFARFAPFLED